MRLEDAIELLKPAVQPQDRVWGDFGAGDGLFSRALSAHLAPGGRVLAIDSDARALRRLREAGSPGIETIEADFRQMESISELSELQLDGALFANSLHYVADPGPILGAAAARMSESGRIVVIEYQDRAANPWVPYPIPVAKLQKAAEHQGLDFGGVFAERPSAFGGRLYAALLGAGTSED